MSVLIYIYFYIYNYLTKILTICLYACFYNLRYMDKKAHRIKAILKIQSEIRRNLGDILRKKGFIELSPVILSTFTDPLNHPTKPANINCYGEKYCLTQSMIFHKQIALKTLDKIFVFSPNVRLESSDRIKTGRHLFEFTQLDLEVKNAKRQDVMKLCEELIVEIIKSIKSQCREELKFLKRELKTPKAPFKKITYQEAYDLYGKDFEEKISKKIKQPVWLIDIPLSKREFYDKENTEKPGFLVDMDLIYPDGYGEALSGGEREYEYEKIKTRIKKKGQKLSDFKEYLKHVKKGVPQSAGFRIGIERLTRYICGLKKIQDTSLFPKIPGRKSL